ncbi:MAG: multiubiquitin domain-containing protein [Planctomycetes bacterium]|nr:multiubiquitin domain-containing protein [Planctomycetota bacterium]
MNADHNKVVIFITVGTNQLRFELDNPVQTGQSLKQLAGAQSTDVLFLRRPGDDPLIRNEDEIKLRNGDHFYTQPPADYGSEACPAPEAIDTAGFDFVRQPDGWTFAIHPAFAIPAAYTPRIVKVLIKLPPLFPQAAPDMFFVTPIVRVANGTEPRGTSMATILGAAWQQFSWHLAPNAWKPGLSTFRDFVACVRARFERKD